MIGEPDLHAQHPAEALQHGHVVFLLRRGIGGDAVQEHDLLLPRDRKGSFNVAEQGNAAGQKQRHAVGSGFPKEREMVELG